VNGIEEGRLIFDNLKKSIAYTLEHLMSEVIPFLAFFLLSIPMPLSTVQILCIDLGTDLFPAISCAYEAAESDIMTRPPRNAQTDKLVGWRLFVFSYFQIGIIQVIGVMTTYFVAYSLNGVPTSQLMGTADDWVNESKLLVLGFGHADRMRIYHEAQAATFLAVVIVQWGGLILCKTRKLSLFTQGMTNHAINISLVVETMIAAFLIYVPGVQTVVGFGPVRFELWLVPMPFSIACVAYDEVRKWHIRTYPGGWVERYTYY
jgi:sodium/potassium-transporting ATPase subunit alpha